MLPVKLLAEQLRRAVCEACGCLAQDLPLLFPSVLAFRLCMAVMAAPAFPLSVLGGVLSGYSAAQLRAVPAAEPLAFRQVLGHASLCFTILCQVAHCWPSNMGPNNGGARLQGRTAA